MIRQNEDAVEKAKLIKAFILDVDGVMTDGGIIYDNHSNEYKRFNVKDGMIIGHLRKQGFKVGVITGRNSKVVELRCNELNMDFQYHGSSDKVVHYNKVKKEFGLTDEQICYIGDDINDLPIFKRCGLSATPADARNYIKQRVDLVTNCNGGHGVVRDIGDFVLDVQGLFEGILNSYLER